MMGGFGTEHEAVHCGRLSWTSFERVRKIRVMVERSRFRSVTGCECNCRGNSHRGLFSRFGVKCTAERLAHSEESVGEVTSPRYARCSVNA
jgi:hypothetical protein